MLRNFHVSQAYSRLPRTSPFNASSSQTRAFAFFLCVHDVACVCTCVSVSVTSIRLVDYPCLTFVIMSRIWIASVWSPSCDYLECSVYLGRVGRLCALQRDRLQLRIGIWKFIRFVIHLRERFHFWKNLYCASSYAWHMFKKLAGNTNLFWVAYTLKSCEYYEKYWIHFALQRGLTQRVLLAL